MSSHSSASSQKRWPIRLVDHKNVYSSILYDVEGKILTHENKMMNLFRCEMQDAMVKKEIRCMRNSTTTWVNYRYFITNQHQLHLFFYERLYGTTDGPNKAYHVYVDEDVDPLCPAYTALFRPAREVDP